MRADRQTDRQTNILIAIFRTSPESEVTMRLENAGKHWSTGPGQRVNSCATGLSDHRRRQASLSSSIALTAAAAAAAASLC